MFVAYILRSLKDGSFYYGSSENLPSRLVEHNTGKVRYTRGHRPYELHYSEQFATRSEAIRREKFFKSIAGYRWLKKQRII
jgi:putative endonuclease